MEAPTRPPGDTGKTSSARDCDPIKTGIVEALRKANAGLGQSPSRFLFHETVGANSRLLLKDGMIHWIGSRKDAVRPTRPFDPELPVLSFQDPAGRQQALIYNHSTHTIGTRAGNVGSPGFYGLAAQELEGELGGTACFLEGATGSTHNITGISTAEAVRRMKRAVKDSLALAELANNWIGYLPDLEAHRLGGYQTWTGLHSHAAPGTGERMGDQVVALLNELAP